MEENIIPHLITRLNRAPDGNLQFVHIAKLVPACHCARRPINIIASFRNAGIVSQLVETEFWWHALMSRHVDPGDHQESSNPFDGIE
jgi:hypothetical protein